jgi:hypothetical protein
MGRASIHRTHVRSAVAAGLAAMLAAPLAAAAEEHASLILASLDAQSRRTPTSWVAVRRLEAEIVGTGERGWMEVRTELRNGQLVHQVLAEGGSERIRKRGLASVLEKEAAACREDESRRAAFTRDNYRYAVAEEGWAGLAVTLTPLRRDPRLIDGRAIVDPETGELVEVSGRLAQHPSFWVRDVSVARRYARVAGVTLPVAFTSSARVRMVGTARLRITNQYVAVNGQPVREPAVLAAANPQD